MNLEVAGAGTYEAEVTACDSRAIVVEFLERPVADPVEEGSVVDMSLPLSWGMYRWICLVRCWGEQKAEIQLLDAPVFVQRRVEPRVRVGLAAEVRTVRGGKPGAPHQAVVADLSRGGLKLTGTKQLRTGDMVEVTFDLPSAVVEGGGAVTLAGRVVMAYPSPEGPSYTMAQPARTDAHVSFMEGQDAAISAVNRFVAQQLASRWTA